MNGPSLFDRVRDEIDPGEYYRATLPTLPTLKPTGDGWSDGGLCCFHDDRRPGSFRVNVRSGAFCCFSCGAKGGSIIDFEARLNGSTPLAAAKALAAEWGVRQ